MALDPVVNFFQSEIATLPVASGGTSIVISSGDGAKLPDPAVDGAYNLTIYEEGNPFSLPEIVRVTTRSSDTLTVTRAQEGTTATTKTAGTTWKVVMFPTAKTIQDIDTAKLDVADVVNNLTSTDTDKALSANQGKVLQDGKLNLSGGTMTGDLTIPDKIIHSGDTNTAIRFPANDTVTVETSGVEAFRVTSEGNVGIGTTSPATKLDINGNTRLRNNGTTSSGDFSIKPSFEISFDGNYWNSALGTRTKLIGSIYGQHNNSNVNPEPNKRITVKVGGDNIASFVSSGNVGIGTTTPATKLDVVGAIRSSTGILFGADTAAANTLDDYEEGTWTPSFSASSGSFGTLTYGTREGKYVKLGAIVFIYGTISTNNLVIGTASGSLTITGAPFSSGADRQGLSPALLLRLNITPNVGTYTVEILNDVINVYKHLANATSPEIIQVSDLLESGATNRNSFSFSGIFRIS